MKTNAILNYAYIIIFLLPQSQFETVLKTNSTSLLHLFNCYVRRPKVVVMINVIVVVVVKVVVVVVVVVHVVVVQ